MKKKAWKAKIKNACIMSGTHRPQFDIVIDTLSSILERRDEAVEYFDETGGEMLVERINKNGSVYMEQNPALRLINELNRDALSYWRDLGLTPAGLKKIDEQSMKQKKRSALAEALKDLGG